MVFKEKNFFNRREKQKRSVVQYDKAGVHVVVFVVFMECCAVSFKPVQCNEACGRPAPDGPDNGSLRQVPCLSSLLTSMCDTPNRRSSFTTCGVSGQESSSTKNENIFFCLHFLLFFCPSLFSTLTFFKVLFDL